MSFGWSIGDIFTCIEILYECGNALKASGGSPEDRIHANDFLSTLSQTITVVQQIYGPNIPTTPGGALQRKDTSTPPPTEEELTSLNALKVLYDKLKDEITKYAGMNKLPNEEEKVWFKRQVQKIKWHFFAKKSIQEIKSKITDQVILLQPSLTARHIQGAVVQAQLFHEESLTNFDDIKVLLRLIVHNMQTNSAQQALTVPTATHPGEPTSLSRASTLVPSPDDYTAYTTASDQLFPFLPPPPTPTTLAASLKRLRVTHKLRLPIKTFLTTFYSASTQSNILWLLDHPGSTQVSAIFHSVLTSLDKPVLSFSASHIDPSNKSLDLSPITILVHAIYTFLHQLLNYLTAHAAEVRQRIDAPAFASLDGTITTLPTAITLLGNLLDNLPGPCIIILDNMQFLDKDALQPQLKEFYALFARRPDRSFATYDGTHKLMMTTRGISAGLSDMGMGKELTRCTTKTEVIPPGNGGGYVLWEEVKSTVEGWKVPDMKRE
jgi:hypothetical protein